MNKMLSVKLLRNLILAATFFWVALIVISVSYFTNDHWQHARDTSKLFNLAILHKELAHLLGNMDNRQGYVQPMSASQEDNSYSSSINKPKIIASSNAFVPLANAVNIVRSVSRNELHGSGYTIHIAGIGSDNPKNRADLWEKNGLSQMTMGASDVSDLVYDGSDYYMRTMIPLTIRSSCLKCHAGQGDQLGDLRGGMSITVPINNIVPIRSHIIKLMIWHLLILLTGLTGLFFFYSRMRGQVSQYCLVENREKLLRDQWDNTFDEIHEIVTIQNNDYQIEQVNKAACQLFQMPPEEIIGKYCYQLFQDLEVPCEDCFARKDSVDNSQHYSTEVINYKFMKNFLVSVTPIKSASGEINSFLHLAKDITRNKEQEKKIQQAQKMEAIGALAGGIAHDFNNILTPILGFAAMAKEELPEECQVSKDLVQIIKAGNRAKDLVQQILTFSRQTDEEKKPVLIHYIVKEALKLFHSSIPANIEIRWNIDSNCRPVMADPTKIHQIIMNLCTNSYHAMREEGGVLSVSLSEVEMSPESALLHHDLLPGEYIKLDVSDTGHGIPREIRDKIFEPYFTTKVVGEGTGLGLATIHSIVRSIQGDVTFESKQGEGTVFHIYLPIIEGEAGTSTIEVSLEAPRGGGESILLVDDQAEVVDLLENMLTRLGYNVTSRTSSIEALELFKKKSADFALVITDMDMPNMRGIELAQKLLEVRPGIPIILCSGFDQCDNMIKNKTLGISEFVMKPVLRSDLAQKILKTLAANK